MGLRLPYEEYLVLCQRVMARDGWKCRHCGYRNNLSCHHVIYRSESGEDASWNLCTLCSSCHDGIHSGMLVIDVAEGNVAGEGGGCDGPLKFYREEGWIPK